MRPICSVLALRLLSRRAHAPGLHVHGLEELGLTEAPQPQVLLLEHLLLPPALPLLVISLCHSPLARIDFPLQQHLLVSQAPPLQGFLPFAVCNLPLPEQVLPLFHRSPGFALEVHTLPHVLHGFKVLPLLLLLPPILTLVIPQFLNNGILLLSLPHLMRAEHLLVLKDLLGELPVHLRNLALSDHHGFVTLSAKLFCLGVLDGLDLRCRALLHLAPLPRSVLFAPKAAISLILFLDEPPDSSGLLLLHEHVQHLHGALLCLLVLLVLHGLGRLLLPDDVKLCKPRLPLLVGLLQPLGGLELLELPLRVQLGQEALPRTFAFHQADVQLLVIVSVQLLEQLGTCHRINLAPCVRRRDSVGFGLVLHDLVLVVCLRRGLLRQAEHLLPPVVLDEVQALNHPMEPPVLVRRVHQL
mmetsp:Transcript_40152/g.93284  ORF Transcript_40152/g.93284 Transcript_40152/m.93284 type:complete len:413 (-) Transcript_40152:243-1481(-)